MNRLSISTLFCGLFVVSMATAEPQVPSDAETSLGLYVTAQEASDMLEADKSIVLIDARPRPAYYYLGHVRNAYSIPARFWTGEFDQGTGTFGFAGNSRFAEDVGTIVKDKKRKIFVMASSSRSGAVAVERLAKGGFTNVYNVLDGFNGWKKAGLPTILKINPKRMYFRPASE